MIIQVPEVILCVQCVLQSCKAMPDAYPFDPVFPAHVQQSIPAVGEFFGIGCETFQLHVFRYSLLMPVINQHIADWQNGLLNFPCRFNEQVAAQVFFILLPTAPPQIFEDIMVMLFIPPISTPFYEFRVEGQLRMALT